MSLSLGPFSVLVPNGLLYRDKALIELWYQNKDGGFSQILTLSLLKYSKSNIFLLPLSVKAEDKIRKWTLPPCLIILLLRKIFWKLKFSGKINIFLWLFCLKKLPIFACWVASITPACCFCGAYEYIDHNFLFLPLCYWDWLYSPLGLYFSLLVSTNAMDKWLKIWFIWKDGNVLLSIKDGNLLIFLLI